VLRVGIVGAGLIGQKRARAIRGAQLVAVADKDAVRARSLAAEHGAAAMSRWEDLVARRDVDAVIVSTSNDAIAGCSVAALEAGKHVLVEKPGGRNPEEAGLQLAVAARMNRILRVGCNHRFHPAFQQAKALLDQGAVGPLLYIRARYGHGGRVGYDREWRADPAVSGGGELLDQGVHLVDLCRWLGGEFDLEYGNMDTFFWDMPVEDNGVLLLRSPDRARRAFLHASCTEWKNLFDFEIFGRDGKVQIWGLGRSYGVEELRVYRMKPEMGPPHVEVTSFPGEDLSWQGEFDAFLGAIEGRATHAATMADAQKAVEIVYEVYRRSGASWVAPRRAGA
jgi:predicted dehydrogenase